MRISRIYLQINNIKRIIRARAVINVITYTTTMQVILNGLNNAFNGIFKCVRGCEDFQELTYTFGMYWNAKVCLTNLMLKGDSTPKNENSFKMYSLSMMLFLAFMN